MFKPTNQVKEEIKKEVKQQEEGSEDVPIILSPQQIVEESINRLQFSKEEIMY
jgi:hypothetical protein